MKNKENRRGSSLTPAVEAPAETAFNSLINETSLLFHRLKIVADQVHHHGEMSGGLRSILRSLEKTGAQTVPQMARPRSVSRQHVQALVNRLVEEGFVVLAQNPAHKKSPLARLTPQGKKYVETMDQREAKLLTGAAFQVSEKKMIEAAETLRAVRGLFESDHWKLLLKKKR